MTFMSPWEPDERYWNAIVMQGQWAENNGRLLSPMPSVNRLSREEMDCKWQHLHRMFEEGVVVCLTVSGHNKGGLLVEWEHLPGFVPTSQLLEAPLLEDDCKRMDCLANYVDRTLKLKIIELDQTQNRIIFSERAAEWGECCPDSRLMTICPGDICEGTVSNLCQFGVFVDLGGIDGLIHISELSWQRVNRAQDLLSLGQRIKVYVIEVDHQRRRIALSLKRLQPNPWATISERYRPGMIIEGVITNMVKFGAFACIEEGVEGLIHISEWHSSPDEPQLEEGLRFPMRVLSVDSDNQRMALSLRGIHDSQGTKN